MLSKSQVKYIQSLGQKKFRDAEGLFIAEGPKIVNEMLTGIPAFIRSIYGLPDWIHEHGQSPGAIEVVEIKEEELHRISQLTTPNKVLAIVEQLPAADFVCKGNITLVLDGIQDPGNLGTIIRTADWFGIRQIVCSVDSADCYNPKVIQATMGSIARVRISYQELMPWLKMQTVPVFAATLAGRDIRKMDKISEGIIVIGNESRGVQAGLLELAIEQITIPKPGAAESLNAAVATAIILSHII